MKKIFTLLASVLAISASQAQVLGIYEFTGAGACPNQNPNVTMQPAGATFSAFSNAVTDCVVTSNVFNANNWDPVNPFNPDKYYEFSITADNGKVLNLDSLNFACRVSSNTATWSVRSSVDNYAANLFTDLSTNTLDTARNELPAGFTGLSSVTFRFYVSGVTDDQRAWRIDDVTVKGTVTNGTAGLNELAAAAFSVFPNPGNDELIIRSGNSEDLNIRIFTSKGKLVSEENISGAGSHKINMSQVDSGIYFIELSGREGKATQRWVKQ
ncbi:MAG: T9SS type A sorting domain-containing protein [Bacteroidota bacterium]